MKRLTLFLLLLSRMNPSLAAQQNPDGYPLTVHVMYSRSIINGSRQQQQLETTINGQEIELLGNSQGVLALGDYPAFLSPLIQAPSSHPNNYDVYQGYVLHLPDGKDRTYTVIGLGPTAPASSAP